MPDGSPLFGIRRPDGLWFSTWDGDVGHFWGSVGEAGGWTSRENVEVALSAMKGKLRSIGRLDFDVDALVAEELPDSRESNIYYADRLNVAWEILRHVAPVQLPRPLQGELGPVIDDVLTAAARLRATPDSEP